MQPPSCSLKENLGGVSGSGGGTLRVCRAHLLIRTNTHRTLPAGFSGEVITLAEALHAGHALWAVSASTSLPAIIQVAFKRPHVGNGGSGGRLFWSVKLQLKKKPVCMVCFMQTATQRRGLRWDGLWASGLAFYAPQSDTFSVGFSASRMGMKWFVGDLGEDRWKPERGMKTPFLFTLEETSGAFHSTSKAEFPKFMTFSCHPSPRESRNFREPQHTVYLYTLFLCFHTNCHIVCCYMQVCADSAGNSNACPTYKCQRHS